MYKQQIVTMILLLSFPIMPARDTPTSDNSSSSPMHFLNSNNEISSDNETSSESSTENNTIDLTLPKFFGYTFLTVTTLALGGAPTLLFTLDENYTGAIISGAITTTSLLTCFAGPQIYKACKSNSQIDNFELEV